MVFDAPDPITLREGRFARLEAIPWWRQERLAQAHVLVVGAGALGNEVIKNLALLGVGNVAIIDRDRIELSNLSRSVLFREEDEGRPKALCAAAAARAIFPQLRVHAIDGELLADVGLGWFRWANVVIGALDNREARVWVNSACARVARPWIDGGIDVLQGIVRGFGPPRTACYECTMSRVDWELLNQRRSCSLLARRARAERGTPTTPTTASIIAALQTQEAVKLLHEHEAMLGTGWVFDGAANGSFGVSYPINPECPWHEPAAEIVSLVEAGSDTPLVALCEEATQRLGGVTALDLSREIVEALECAGCRRREEVFRPAEKIDAAQLRCAQCGGEASPVFLHSIVADSPLLARTPAQLGLPCWDIVWARRGGDVLGFEFVADRPVDCD
jgi:molybdopterin/thiamine biosynthesis adenylyltransferase